MKPLSIERHRELGEALYVLRDQAQKLVMKYQDGLCARELHALMKIERVFDRARSVLEDRAFKDHPDLSEPPSLYFGTDLYERVCQEKH
jgi:hypothetical protein